MKNSVHATRRVKQSHVWGWLDPSSNADLMPVTYLKGAGAAIGRGAEAFEAQQGQQADSASNIEAAMQTGRYLPPQSCGIALHVASVLLRLATLL